MRDAVVKVYELIGGNCHQEPIAHHEFDPRVTGSANGFALFQGIPNLEYSTNALGVNSENVARTIDGSDGCELGHEELR